MSQDYVWRADPAGSQWAISLWRGDVQLPWNVCKVVWQGAVSYEAWARSAHPRGGYWGGERLGSWPTPQPAKRHCEAEADKAN